jgi:hypothetical protein
MLDLFNILTFCWLALWALYALRLLAAGRRHSILFVFIFHFVSLPLLKVPWPI